MQLKRFSLRRRIFLSMTFLVVMASVLIVAVTIYQYREEAIDYHFKRLRNTENSLRTAMSYVLKNTTSQDSEETVDSVIKSHVEELADIHNSEIHFYNLDGKMIASSIHGNRHLRHQNLSEDLLQKLASNPNHRLVYSFDDGDMEIQALFFYIYNTAKKPVAILHIPYLNNNADLDLELREFLARLGGVYVLLFIIAVIVAYIISSYITRSLKTIGDKMNTTRLYKLNEKIVLNNASEEIYTLISAYNGMIDELEESAVKLAQIEREEAWREMAKQVAHEIKNPLTPMRLTIQSFQQRFEPTAPNYKQKLNEVCKSLIEQIDTMSAVATAFSSFAMMPEAKNENINMVAIIKGALEIFTEDYIEFTSSNVDITIQFDKAQLIRIITNLVKNAIQATHVLSHPKINVEVSQTEKYVFIKVKDNGSGIAPENLAYVFEPKFTTKSSGMGLGLPIVKKIIETYNGSITFTTNYGIGTEFTVTLPKT